MYRKSFFMVLLAVALIGLVTTGTRIVSAIPGISSTPSVYDPKLSVEDAVKTSDKPLLIEFYTDECHTCQIISPWMHRLSKKYKDDFTFVMVDANDPRRMQVSQIFGIEYVPAIFIFDFHHMAKAQISLENYGSYHDLDKGIQAAQIKVKEIAAEKGKRAMRMPPPILN